MVSKTSLLEAVQAFDWKALNAGLKERPDLLSHREERAKNWLHVLCSTKLKGRKPAASIKTADVLLERGIDPAIRSKPGVTALDLAREYKHPELVAFLEKKK